MSQDRNKSLLVTRDIALAAQPHCYTELSVVQWRRQLEATACLAASLAIPQLFVAEFHCKVV